MGKLLETADMSDTAPLDPNGERYVGPIVNPTTGELICPKCHKPYSKCTCKDTGDLHKATTDDPLPARMGNVPKETQEAIMDFYDGLDTLMLEEFLTPKKIEESMKNPTPEEVKMAKTFTENFHAYMERNSDRFDRKPSDVATKPNSALKVLYNDHFNTKFIR